jgi:hypothetical protein
VVRVNSQTDSEPAHAYVFTTIIYREQLYYLCLKISADATITSGVERRQTPDDLTLPLVPIRSFAEQRAVLKAPR